MTNIESITEAYERARKDEDHFTTRFTFEGPIVVYKALLKEYGLRNNGSQRIVKGGFISARARRSSPYFSSNLNPTPMVCGTVVISGFSQAGMDQLVHGVIDCFHDNDRASGLPPNQVSFGYELVSPYRRPTEKTLEPMRPSD